MGGGADARAPLSRPRTFVQRGEERFGEDAGVGGAPACDLDAADGIGVIGFRMADPDYGCASQVSPGSSSTTSADVASRSSSGVPVRIGKVA
jgi:hypothetical protein